MLQARRHEILLFQAFCVRAETPGARTLHSLRRWLREINGLCSLSSGSSRQTAGVLAGATSPTTICPGFRYDGIVILLSVPLSTPTPVNS